MSETWFYFGCVREAGHYLFDRNGNKARGYGGPEQFHLREALSHFDSVLPPPRDQGLYRASFSTLGGLRYCALSWWDCSVDKRPGSNSTVFAPGLNWTPERLLEIYPKAFPWLAERQPQPVTLCQSSARAEARAPDVAGLVEAASQAKRQFEFYVEQHMGKQPPDRAKAKTNERFADLLHEALAPFSSAEEP